MLTNANRSVNIGQWLPQSRVNGPGLRFVIWFQGCSLQCPGCCNLEFQSHVPQHLFTIQELYEMIVRTPNIEGVTYSGGESFEQAEGAYLLSQLVRQAGLTVVAYSGYTYEDLCRRNDPAINGLLSQLDILIDGPFDAAQAASLLWRGSRNQRVHFLTGRYQTYANEVDREGVELEVHINGGTASVTGNVDDALVNDLISRL
jgi:anaerobic ribonucleoside-triphosphate reductase activating protein